MTIRPSAFLVLLLVGAGLAALAQTPADQDLLVFFDHSRFLERTTTGITVQVSSQTSTGSEEATLRLLFGTVEGQDRVRIEFLAPADLAGQVYLATPDRVYFWQPDLAAPLAISSRQSLFGDSAVAQTSGVRFAGDYAVSGRRDRALDDGTKALEVTLQALRPSVAFPQVVVLADAASLRPISLTLYALSGAPLYDVHIDEYAEADGDLYARTQTVTNLLIEGNVTRSEIRAIESGELPDRLFDPAALGS